MGNWKAFVSKVMSGKQHIELYDLITDPREQHDVSAEHPKVVEHMLSVIRKEHKEPALDNFKMPIW